MLDLVCGHTVLAGDLIEPVIELRQRVCNAVGRALVSAGCGETYLRMRLCEAFELSRELVETLIDRREVVADRVLVAVVIVSV